MKKRSLCLLLVLALVCSLSAPVLADLGTVTISGGNANMPAAGFCLTNDKADGVTITPQGATYKSFRGTVAGISGVGGNNEVTLYPGSTTLKVSVSGTNSGYQYTVMLLQGGKEQVPTYQTIKYVNQSAGGTLEFTINPITPAQGNLTVWVTSNDPGFATRKVLIGYVAYNTPVTNAKNYKLGDVTGDDSVTAADATPILQYAVNLTTLTPLQLAAGDTTKDGTVTAADATPILQFAVNIIQTLE